MARAPCSDAIVEFQATFACVDYALWRLRGLLGEHLEDDDCVGVDPKDETPDLVLIRDAQLVAPTPDGRHGPGMRHAEPIATLETPQEKAHFQSRFARQWWCPDLSVKPYERLVLSWDVLYVRRDIIARGEDCGRIQHKMDQTALTVSTIYR